MTDSNETGDNHYYSWVAFYRDTIEFLLTAVRFYERLLAAEAAEVDADPDLKEFLTEDIRRDMRIDRGRNEAQRMARLLEDHLAKSDGYSCDFGLAHGTVRYLKSVGLLYLGFLKQRRNTLSGKPNVTAHLLSALDRQITQREEQLTHQGVFGKASLVPLLAAQETPTADELNTHALPEEVPISQAQRPKPVLVDSIEILDPELRRRCLDLFHQFESSAQADRHDTVVTEATRILEDRLRKLTRSTDGATGSELATRAFGGSKPVLRVSAVEAEQQAAHLLYRGVFGFIRNSVHHKLRPDLAPERVIQILGLIDYLVYLADTGQTGDDAGTQATA